MKYYISVLFLFGFTLNLLSIDKYSVGDTLYIWSDNGMNVRESPSLKGRIIDVLSACEEVIVVKKTDSKIAFKSLQPAHNEKHPYYIRGHWVKVSYKGKYGYLFDAYLLPISCKNTSNLRWLHKLPEVFHIIGDTLINKFEQEKTSYEVGANINIFIKESGESVGFELHFSDWSIEDVFIFLKFFYKIDGADFVSKNWKNDLHFTTDESFCRWRITQKEGDISVFGSCSY